MMTSKKVKLIVTLILMLQPQKVIPLLVRFQIHTQKIPRLRLRFTIDFSGATISENESFSLTSDEDLTNKPLLTTQASSEEQAPEAEANSEAAIPSIMLPANHVIQYSPRLLASSNKSSWSPEMQTYEDQDKVEPMEIDNNLNRDSSQPPRDDSGQELLKQLSCPLYPRGECHVVKTELRLDLQLDHDQNSNGNSAGAEAAVDVPDAAAVEDLKGDINNLSSEAEVQIAETPSPKPRSSFSQKSAVAESSQSPEAAANRKPVPTPRKSVTLMEVDQEPPSPHHRAASALSHHEKKISFSIGKFKIL